VEDVLSCVDQKMQDLRKELAAEIDETQAIRTSVHTPTKSLLETITDTREYLHKASLS
jgi:hypothetical protein